MKSTMVVPCSFSGLRVICFFTTKAVGSDLHTISRLSSIPPGHIFLPIQKHTDTVLVLQDDLEPRVADAVITNRKGILIGVRVADCVPILLYDPQREAVGAVHAGWRGTAAGILKKTAEEMTRAFSTQPSDLHIAIGPAIRRCCYEVGAEVVEAVSQATGAGEYGAAKGEKYCIDLPAANRIQALSMGVPPERIWLSDECTSCLPEKYFSYRYTKGHAGRQSGFIGLI